MENVLKGDTQNFFIFWRALIWFCIDFDDFNYCLCLPPVCNIFVRQNSYENAI